MSVEKKTGTNVKQAVPFFGVSNMAESLRFYLEGLRFEMTKKWIDEGKLRWCWLEIGEAALCCKSSGRKVTIPGSRSAKWAKAYRSVSCARMRWRSIMTRHLGELR